MSNMSDCRLNPVFKLLPVRFDGDIDQLAIMILGFCLDQNRDQNKRKAEYFLQKVKKMFRVRLF